MQRKSFDECKELFLQARAYGNWNDVVVWSTELIHINDGLGYVWANRGIGLSRLGHHLDAILNYDKAITLEKDDDQLSILYSNKGAAYWDIGNAEEALKWLYKAIELSPLPQTYLTVGNIYKFQGKLQKAIGAYRDSIKHGPDYVDGHMVLGMALLKAKNLQEGWQEYAWRWKSDQLPARKLKCPEWRGESLNGKTILVYGEQGLGDILQFARYARVLANKFPRCKVILEGRQPVKRLLETIPEVYAVINGGDALPAIDYAVPMLNLAGLLTPNVGAIPASDFEFFLKRSDIENWTERLKPLTDLKQGAFKVGICWAGMSRDSNPSALAIDLLRSTSFETFAKLANIPNIVWVSLQKGKPAAELKNPPKEMLIGDFTDDMHDFYETCCAAANCDLVISVDTAVVHAVASIGVPVWLLSRWDGCWRWFGDGTDSPWYPTLRQFVQPSSHDWDGVMKKVAKELRKLTEDKNQQELDLTLAK